LCKEKINTKNIVHVDRKKLYPLAQYSIFVFFFKSKIMSILIVVSAIGLEVGLGHLASLIDDGICVRKLRSNQLRVVQTDIQCYEKIIVCGDWGNSVQSYFSDREVFNVTFEPGSSPTSRLIALVDDQFSPSDELSSILQLLDEHITGGPERSLGMQYFSTGLAHWIPSVLSHEALLALMKNPAELPNVIKIGEQIHNSLVQMINARVQVNSRRGVIPNSNIPCAIAQSPEYIVMTHAALHAKYPDVPVTVVIMLSFDADKDRLRYSLRSFDPSIDVQKIAQSFGGGGTPLCAGFNNVLDEMLIK
jgi:hypothetical protein